MKNATFNLTILEWISLVAGFLWSGGLSAYEIVTLTDIKDNNNLGAIKPFPELILV